MRSNKKGFTLIELLAVIVILAIIALIATPIVLSIIAKARRSAAQDSLYGVISAAKTTYMSTLLDSDQITLPAYIECDGTSCGVFKATTADNGATYTKGDAQQYGTDTKTDFKVDFSGTVPGKTDKLASFVILSNGKVNAATDIDVNGFTCEIKANETVECK